MSARAPHRLVAAALALLVFLWLVLSIVVAVSDGDGAEFTIRLVVLLVVAVGAFWLVAAGLDAGHPGSSPLLELLRPSSGSAGSTVPASTSPCCSW